VPVIPSVIAATEWYALTHDRDVLPFLGAVRLFLISFVGIAISLWPMIVPAQNLKTICHQSKSATQARDLCSNRRDRSRPVCSGHGHGQGQERLREER
jgi:cytochrome bd-type quinol oxidase subunit 2